MDSTNGFVKMRRFATALLVVVTVVYFTVRLLTNGTGAWGFVQAGAEAGMVGAIADWFAVTALFRHPLGLPIPHTAIVAERKNEIGRGLGEFVQTNFLTPGVLGQRISDAKPATRIGEWLSEPKNVETVADGAARAIAVGASMLRDDEVSNMIEAALRHKMESVQAAPVVGKVLDNVRGNGRQQLMIATVLDRLGEGLHANKTVLRQRFNTESPWWVPEQIDDKVFTKLFDGFTRFIDELRDDPDHQIRHEIDRRIDAFVADLQTNPDMIQKGEKMKGELLDHPAMQSFIASAWTDLKESLLKQTRDSSSDLRARVRRTIAEFGERLRNDEELRARVDKSVSSAVLRAVESSGQEVADLITTTVERWDTDETVDRIESQIGRDLQFIRINGTVVGSLAGFAIHAVSLLIGH